MRKYIAAICRKCKNKVKNHRVLQQIPLHIGIALTVLGAACSGAQPVRSVRRYQQCAAAGAVGRLCLDIHSVPRHLDLPQQLQPMVLAGVSEYSLVQLEHFHRSTSECFSIDNHGWIAHCAMSFSFPIDSLSGSSVVGHKIKLERARCTPGTLLLMMVKRSVAAVSAHPGRL